MATNTYVALDKVTVGTATPSITFTGINQGYTDLVVVFSGSASASDDFQVQVNSDTGSNYSRTWLTGNGTTAASSRGSSQTYMRTAQNGYLTTGISNIVMQFMNYSNTTTNKTVLSRANNASTGTDAHVNLWRSTSAITSIYCYLPSANFAVGSTFSLYGIKAQVTPGTAKATGGTITYDQSGNVIHTFTSSGTFTPTTAITGVEYLVIAGGGSGGQDNSGAGSAGGGAGGYRSSVLGELSGGNSFAESTLSCASGVGLTVTVGAGGAALTVGSNANGNNGTDSVFGSITATGGGGGARGRSANATVGNNGGSGGGGGPSTISSTGGSGTANQGFAGGIGGTYSGSSYGAGGGGGAGAIGGSSTSAGAGGVGGTGISSAVTGSYVARAGGGSGSTFGASNTAGSTGGGGTGGSSGTGAAGGTGTVNTGSGGGGVYGGSAASGAGGSGIVIIRYSGV